MRPARPVLGVALAVLGAAVLASCLTEPVCACSEPGSTMVVYGTVSESAVPAAGAEIRIALGEVATVATGGTPVESCESPGQASLDDPAPALADAGGRYRVAVLSTARLRRCVIVSATTATAVGSAKATTTFQPPGGLDSVRVDLVLTAP